MSQLITEILIAIFGNHGPGSGLEGFGSSGIFIPANPKDGRHPRSGSSSASMK